MTDHSSTPAVPGPSRSRRRSWKLRHFGALLLLGCAGCAAAHTAASPDPDEPEWVQLFNGRDLEGWVPKFTGHELGHNFRNTFRVEDGLLRVSFDNWSRFNGEFGHLFYQQPFSHYIVAAEYRFVGEQPPGGPDWARRNNGLMLHSQAPETMSRDQDFPISIEVQLLVGMGEGARPTANLCTPGTRVVLDGELLTAHCVGSRSRTFHGDQWVRVETLVLGDSLAKHIVHGDTVMQYTALQMGGGGANNLRPGVMREGEPLREGYIALQAESAPTDFRKVEVLNLKGCTDPRATNFKSYYVEPDPEACRYDGAARRR
jgi:hypothetical protein